VRRRPCCARRHRQRGAAEADGEEALDAVAVQPGFHVLVALPSCREVRTRSTGRMKADVTAAAMARGARLRQRRPRAPPSGVRRDGRGGGRGGARVHPSTPLRAIGGWRRLDQLIAAPLSWATNPMALLRSASAVKLASLKAQAERLVPHGSVSCVREVGSRARR